MTNCEFRYTDERFTDIQMLRYRLEGFETLTLRQKQYVYCLSEAALWGRDIVTDQCGRHNLRIRRTLEALLTTKAIDKNSLDFKKMETYLKRVWFSNGIHHHYGSEKFAPEFSRTWFVDAVHALPSEELPLAEGETKEQLAEELAEVIFNSDVMPKRVNRTDGADVVATSACNYYDGLTQQEAEDYYGAKKINDTDTPISHGLNSRLVKDAEGALVEQVWKIDGMYGDEIEHIVYWLKRALDFVENEEQTTVIRTLIEYYETGDLHTFDDYSVAWVKATSGMVDFVNGFIEVYGDPLGLKASWESIVEYKDIEASQRTQIISDNAQWFEDNAPIDPRFKKKEVKGISATVVRAAMLGGDEYPSTAIGINLPNADWIRATHGSKSVTISNITEAYKHAAQGSGLKEEFVDDIDMRAMMEKYGDMCDNLHTDLHECLGHGSGQLLDDTDADALKAYASTIEEARADLFGLYYMADKKMVELGLLPNTEVYKAQYYGYMMNGVMTQLVRIQPGNNIEEDHMRNRALIARWCLAQGKAMELTKKDGKTYLKVNDYQELRRLIATLLAEVQRIKSEGDIEAARHLVEEYGVEIDPILHTEILERYKKLNIAPYKGFINPILRPVYNKVGDIIDVVADYTEGYTQQMLRYGQDYSCGRISSEHRPDVSNMATKEKLDMRIKEIKRSFRLLMNGVVSQSMREKGSDYHINWGASLPMLKDKAKELGQDDKLACALWRENVRECKVLATMTMPPSRMTRHLAETWMNETTTQEIAELLAFNLFSQLDFATAMALDWIESQEELRKICGYHIISRQITTKYNRAGETSTYKKNHNTIGKNHNTADSAEMDILDARERLRCAAAKDIQAQSVAVRKATSACLIKLSEYENFSSMAEEIFNLTLEKQ